MSENGRHYEYVRIENGALVEKREGHPPAVDIVDRLIDVEHRWGNHQDRKDGAAEILRLRAQVDRLTEEVARLRAIVEPATDLIENIRAYGLHDNWKTLAYALDDLARAALPRETT